MTQSFSFPVVVCRPALPRDTADVLEFTKFTWDDGDYIQYVWDDWFADPQGILAAAEYGGHCVGIAKITLSAPGQWWLEGLRVDPKFQGLRIGSHLHAYVNAWWLAHGDGAARFMTSSTRVKVHHLAEKLGYQKVLEMKELEAPVTEEPCETFQPVQADEIPAAMKFALNSPQLASSHGFFDIGWDALQPTKEILASMQEQGNTYWWHDREGLFLAWRHTDDEGDVLGISLPVCPMERLPEMLRDIRRLAAQRNCVGVFWIAPLKADILSAADAAGFIHHCEHDNYLYEKQHG